MIIAPALLLRRGVTRFRPRETPMKKEWESVLGQMVLFTEEVPGKWSWECPTLNVAHDPSVRFTSQPSARVAAAVLIFSFFVMEEATSAPVLPSTSPSAATPAAPSVLPLRPPQGGGGRR